MSDIISVPTSMTIDLPASLRGPKGDQGDPGKDGKDGAATFTKGEWKPVIGGALGETGQIYSSQWGAYRIANGMCHLRGYCQFAAQGDIQGQLVLKGLPVPTAYMPTFFGGYMSYFSNPRPSAGPLILHASGAKDFAFIFNAAQPGNNPMPAFADNTVNYHSQFVIVFDYFID
jgi:hypothetical protein